MATEFKIHGVVREKESGQPLPRVQVRAYDRDLHFDDLLGETEADEHGRFVIAARERDFREFLDESPDVYFEVTLPDGRAHSTRHDVRWNVGRVERFVVEVPGELLKGRPKEEEEEPGHEHPDGHAHADHVDCGWCGHSHGREDPCRPAAAPTRCRDIYLKIEKLPAYSPVAPDDAEHHKHRRDCMRNPGHEDATIPHAEEEQRKVEAVVYREYFDPAYTIPNTAPLCSADINEPRFDRRIPGAVLYAEPGERLFIHVLNADDHPHSFHIHGLGYGIDSDGSWPFGVQDAEGRRSDAICPGDEWCYTYDVTEDTIGVWPFHDHHMHIFEQVNRGLFGGLIVRDPRCPKPDIEVPFFLHRLGGGAPRTPRFDSGTLLPGGTFFATFPDEGTFEYFCSFHPMRGTVRVTAGGPAAASVSIKDGPGRFDLDDVTVRPGGVVTWTHQGAQPHTVTDAGGGGLESLCINGRCFIGNTPTVRARTGRRVRWYVFNLDLGMMWHNFHIHGQRFRAGHEMVDTRTIGPAESFIADTVVPPVILLPLRGDCGEHASHCCRKEGEERLRTIPGLRPAAALGMRGRAALGGGHTHGDGHTHGNGHGHDEGHGHAPAAEPETHAVVQHGGPGHTHPEREVPGLAIGRKVRLRGDFLVHCHVEMHMMEGMAALLRAVQTVPLSKELAAAYCFELPFDRGDECPDVDLHPCGHGGGGGGSWERLPDSPIFIVHAAVLRTGKVVVWSGTAEVGDPLESRVWDPATGTMTTQLFAEDLFCAGQTFLPDGRLLVGGGAPAGSLDSTHIFDPATESWAKVNDMLRARWYPTLVPLADGRVMAFSGSGVTEVEVYDPGTGNWTLVSGATRNFPELYPSLHLLPSGQIFYSRSGWAMADTGNTNTGYLALTGPASGTWSDLGSLQFNDRQEGTAVIHVDTSVSPATARVMVIGGGVSGAPTARSPQTAEKIDLTALTPAPAWSRTADMNFPRVNVNAVLLPDGNVLVIGGQRAGKWNADPQAVLEPELYDPRTDTWTVLPPMQHPRQYHSVAVLLPDGRVLGAGGVDPSAAERDLRSMEVFSPPYLFMGPRPVISACPANAAYGATFDVDTPDAAAVDSVVLMRPCATTHHTDAGQRYVKLAITGRTAGQVTVAAPADGNQAAPGYYMLFVVKANGVPSEACWVRLS